MSLCFRIIRYAPRWDCGSEYNIHVDLLNGKGKPIKTFAPETVYFEQWNDQQWNQVRKERETSERFRGTDQSLPLICILQITHVFHHYGRGVRFIRFTHGGKDTQFWAGWYGIRVTDSCVEICPEIDT